MLLNIFKKSAFLAVIVFVFSFISETSYAQTTDSMPWDSVLTKISKSIQGPVAKVLGAFAMFGLGMGLAFSEGSGSQKKALWVIFGLSIAFNAGTWGLTLMGFAGGVLV